MARRESSSPTPASKPRRKASRFPADHDEAAGLARLQRVVGADADQVEVDYSSVPSLRLQAAGKVLLDGAWQIEVLVDQAPVPLDGHWQCVCWNTDDEGDYLELHLTTSKGLTVERQYLLSRKEPWVFLAAKVSRAKGKRVDVISTFSCPLKVSPGDAGTRELRIAGTPGARLYPLGLPQETVAGCTGSFTATDGTLRLHQANAGTGAYVPLLVDWDSAHRKVPAVWKSLTVTEDGRVLKPDQAVGYRWQVGGDHLLIYHTLQMALEARAVLGHNTRYETLVGRFEPSGDVDQIVAIETGEE